MIIHVLLIGTILSSSFPQQQGSEVTACIEGRVIYADIGEIYGVDDRISDATVMLKGTSMGTMSDSTGYFILTDIPPGEYVMTVSHIEFIRNEFPVVLTEGDTIDVGNINMYIDSFFGIDYYIWPEFEVSRTIKIEFTGEDTPGSAISFIGSSLLPWDRDGNTYTIQCDETSTSIRVVIPEFGDFWIPLTADSTADLSISIDLDSILIENDTSFTTPLFEHLPDFINTSRHQWLASGYSIDRRYIDISQYGMNHLQNFGYNNYRVLSNGDLLLVYHRYAVIIDESGNVTQLDFEFPVRKFFLSDNSRYFLVFESVGDRQLGGRAQMMDLDSNSSIVFDPTPDTPGIDSYRTEFDLSFSYRLDRPTFLITDHAEIARITRGKIVLYWDDYSVAGTLDYADRMIEITNADLLDREGILTVFGSNPESGRSVMYFDRLGNLLRQYSIADKDSEFRIVYQSISRSGEYIALALICISSDYSEIPDETRIYDRYGNLHASLQLRATSIAFSESEDYCVFHSALDYPQLVLYSIPSQEEVLRIDDRYTRQYDQYSVIRSVLNISDNGDIFLLLTDDRGSEIEERYALLNSYGDIIWLGACTESTPRRNWYYISNDGSCISFKNGQYINQIEFGSL